MNNANNNREVLNKSARAVGKGTTERRSQFAQRFPIIKSYSTREIQKRGCEEKEDQFLLDFTAPCFLVKNSETRKKRKQPPPRGATGIFMQKIATLPPGVGSVCYRICRGYVR